MCSVEGHFLGEPGKVGWSEIFLLHLMTIMPYSEQFHRTGNKIYKSFYNTTENYQLSHVWDKLLTDVRNCKSVLIKTSAEKSNTDKQVW